MATALRRPVSHEDRLSLTEHPDELRSRLVICVLGLVVCFGFCFWQADRILEIVNKPLEQTQNLDGKGKSNDPLEQNARFQTAIGRKARADAVSQRRQGEAFRVLAGNAETAGERRAWAAAATASFAAARASEQAAAAEPTNKERQPVTLGVAEPFTTTVSVSFYAGL